MLNPIHGNNEMLIIYANTLYLKAIRDRNNVYYIIIIDGRITQINIENYPWKIQINIEY